MVKILNIILMMYIFMDIVIKFECEDKAEEKRMNEIIIFCTLMNTAINILNFYMNSNMV